MSDKDRAHQPLADRAGRASPEPQSTQGLGHSATIPCALRTPDEIWKEATIGREGYCSSDLQDAARAAIATAQLEAIEAAARSAEGAFLPDGYLWSESNQEKFRFGAEVAATRVRVLAVCVNASGIEARSDTTGTGVAEGKSPAPEGRTPND